MHGFQLRILLHLHYIATCSYPIWLYSTLSLLQVLFYTGSQLDVENDTLLQSMTILLQ